MKNVIRPARTGEKNHKSGGDSSRSGAPQSKKFAIEKVANVRVVYSLNAGGRKQRMSAFAVVGTGAGRAGLGIGKAKDTFTATTKAVSKAGRRMVRVGVKEKRTVYHSITSKFCSSVVRVMPSPAGSGLKCNNTMRLFLEACGIKDASVKVIKGRHPINSLKALSKALTEISTPRERALKRGVSLSRVLNLKPTSENMEAQNV